MHKAQARADMDDNNMKNTLMVTTATTGQCIIILLALLGKTNSHLNRTRLSLRKANSPLHSHH